MNDSDWEDPFQSDDRARRRAERQAKREARRQKREKSEGKREDAGGAREALGERVREELSGEAPKAPLGSPPEEQPQTSETPAATPPVDARPHTEDLDRPQTGEFWPAEGGESGDLVDVADPVERPTDPRLRSAAARNRSVRRRRFVALFFFVALVGVLAAGAYAFKHRNDDAPPPAPAPKPRKTFDVTIPEGYTRADMAKVAKKAGLKGDYMKASESSKKLDLGKYGAKDAKNLEGFLFPATYELFKGATAQDLVDKQVEAFKDNLSQVDLSYAKSKNLTPYDVTIVASMIEREIQKPDERKLAASVIYNRLKDGTPLGIDATIRYEDDNFTEPLVESRLEEDTPYNTRTNTGLPPGPIGNPGLDSLEAAANPAKTDYFFYVVKPGACGEHVFVKTQAQFDQATAKYNAAREAAGGKSPTDC